MKLPVGQPVVRDEAYIEWLKTQPCIFTGTAPTDSNAVDPMHIGTLGKGIKSPDNEALPVLHSIHQAAHSRGEMSMIKEVIPNWLLRDALRAYARECYALWKKAKEDGTLDL